MAKLKTYFFSLLLFGILWQADMSLSFAHDAEQTTSAAEVSQPASQSDIQSESSSDNNIDKSTTAGGADDTKVKDDVDALPQSDAAEDAALRNGSDDEAADDADVPSTGQKPVDAGDTEESNEETDALNIDDNTKVVGKSKEELPYEELRRFAMVFAAIKNRYVEPIGDDKLIDGAIQGMLEELDPHSNYLNKEDFASLQEATEGEFGGLGIEISEGVDSIHIIAPIEGSPADKAGVLPGDQIIEVDGKSISDKPIGDLIKQLRGEPGTEVNLVIKRTNNDKYLHFKLKRDVIKVQSVRAKSLPDNIAYVRISQFQERSIVDLVSHLNNFKQPPKGLVLDLRNNPGGLLNAAVGVAGSFIKAKDLVVFTKSRGQVGLRYYVTPGDYSLDGSDPLRKLPAWTRKVPMVILINVGSASASEIVAGALQDYQRATIMGNRSFGKGSVQVVLPLDDETGIKLTVARYYTAKGRSIQATGIKPDITVSDTAKGDLFAFPREADLRDHLSNDTQPEEVGGTGTEDLYSDPEAMKKEMFEFGSNKDFQLQQAVNHLLGKRVDQGVPATRPKNKQTTVAKKTTSTTKQSNDVEDNTHSSKKDTMAEPASSKNNDAANSNFFKKDETVKPLPKTIPAHE